MDTASRTTKRRLVYGGLALATIVGLALVGAGAAGAFGGGHGGFAAGMAGDRPALDACHRERFTETDGVVTGGCLRFSADPTSGTVSAFTATKNGTSTELVVSISVPALAGGTEQLRHGYAITKDDIAFLAGEGPGGFVIASKNGTAATLTFPVEATIVLHPAVDDWSPAGATVTYGALKANLVLPPGSTVSHTGQTLTLVLTGGPASFHLLGDGHARMEGGFGHGTPRGPGGPHGGPRGPR